VYFLISVARRIKKWVKAKKVEPKIKIEAMQKTGQMAGEASSTISFDRYAATTSNRMQTMTKYARRYNLGMRGQMTEDTRQFIRVGL
jgi:hypothetical protein